MRARRAAPAFFLSALCVHAQNPAVHKSTKQQTVDPYAALAKTDQLADRVAELEKRLSAAESVMSYYKMLID
jgi:hypothetical protein